ncbi:MAG TPA: redoxin domain-containing protein [Cyclobacteriaceae bacterium]|jgi:thioredoxin-related protein
MHSIRLLLSAILVVAAFNQMQCSKTETRKPAGDTPEAVNELPEVRLVFENQRIISARELSGKTILIFFRTECDHCQREATAIRENLDAFREYQIYFVGTDGQAASQKFAEDYSLAGNENVHFVQTDVNDILNNLGPISTPSLYIYSAEKKLIRHLDGETPIGEILRHL